MCLQIAEIISFFWATKPRDIALVYKLFADNEFYLFYFVSNKS